MAYDEKLANRIEEILINKRSITQKKMFGGLCFLYHGNMTCGIVGDCLMLRVGPEYYDATLKLKHVAKMDFTGKPMKGMVYVRPEGLKRKADLEK